jgi:hypothetical protein
MLDEQEAAAKSNENESNKSGSATEASEGQDKKSARREIPGNLPYTATPGALNKSLDAIITAERPDRVSSDFVETVLKIPGGSGRPIPAILKRVGFLDGSGAPTERYSKFKSDSARSRASLEGLKQGFAEIYRRNEYAHRLNESELKDLVIEITGLKKNDNIVSSILGTFRAFSRFVKDEDVTNVSSLQQSDLSETRTENGLNRVALQYHINIALPETSDIKVYNAIFKSLRENLL